MFGGGGVDGGRGAWPFAVLLTGLVVFVNLGLRPLVKLLKKYTAAGAPVLRVTLVCTAEQEAAMRGLVVRTLALGGMHLSEIATVQQDGQIEVSATVSGEGVTDAMVEQAVLRIAAEPG